MIKTIYHRLTCTAKRKDNNIFDIVKLNWLRFGSVKSFVVPDNQTGHGQTDECDQGVYTNVSHKYYVATLQAGSSV